MTVLIVVWLLVSASLFWPFYRYLSFHHGTLPSLFGAVLSAAAWPLGAFSVLRRRYVIEMIRRD